MIFLNKSSLQCTTGSKATFNCICRQQRLLQGGIRCLTGNLRGSLSSQVQRTACFLPILKFHLWPMTLSCGFGSSSFFCYFFHFYLKSLSSSSFFLVCLLGCFRDSWHIYGLIMVPCPLLLNLTSGKILEQGHKAASFAYNI